MEYGEDTQAIATLDSGSRTRLMASVSMNGQMVIDLKVNGGTA